MSCFCAPAVWFEDAIFAHRNFTVLFGECVACRRVQVVILCTGTTLMQTIADSLARKTPSTTAAPMFFLKSQCVSSILEDKTFDCMIRQDWVVLSWRYELHLLSHAFPMDAGDADRQGVPEDGNAMIIGSWEEKEKIWLVVWLPCFIFPYIGLLIIPID